MLNLNNILLLLLVLGLVQSNDRYSYSQTITSIGNKDKIVFSHDDAWMIAYSESEDNMDIYNAFTFQKKFSIKTSNPTYVASLENQDKKKAFVLGTKDGDILYTYFQDNDNKMSVTIKLDNVGLPIVKIFPNADGTLYAASCEGSTDLYHGPLTQIRKAEKLEFNASISNFEWHPSNDQIAIALQVSEDNAAQLLIYNYYKKTYTNLSQQIAVNFSIVDLTYSKDGSKIAYINYSIPQEATEALIPILNLASFELEYQHAFQANELVCIQREGSLLTAYDSSYAYVWQFDNLTLGKYQSILKSIGLSNSASYLVTLDSLENKLLVYKYCIQNNTFFNNQLIKCEQCTSPCSSCFLKQTKCSSCVDRYFLKQSDYTCAQCMANCKICSNAQACSTCIDGFYKTDEFQCQACLLGCAKCVNKDACLTCDANNHWKLNQQTKTCECQSKFYLNLDKCDNCIKGCLNCSNSNECKVCDGASHRVLKPQSNTCDCAQYYFEDIEQCKQCLKGCLICNNAFQCTTCDTAKHWIANLTQCTCHSGYVDVSNECKMCSSVLQACVECKTVDICLECSQGYSINADTNKCVKNDEETSVAIYVVAIVGSLVVIGVIAFCIVRMIKRKNAKKMETLLQEQQQLQSQN